MTAGHESPVQSGHRLEQVVAAVIVLNTGLLVWGLVGHSEFADRLETGCIVFFVAEILVRLHRARWHLLAFLAQPWQAFDVAVIALAFMPSLGVGITLLRVARLARLVHVGRHATHLRLFRLWRRPAGTLAAVALAAMMMASNGCVPHLMCDPKSTQACFR